MQNEKFQPIPVTAPAHNPTLFKLRCFVDLQLDSIVKHLQPAMPMLKGKVLDVGAGESPWKEWLPKDCEYVGIDVDQSSQFGMSANRKDIFYFDGQNIPFSDESFDGSLCIEVLEHAKNPELLTLEIARVLRGNATLLLTVPWSARRHHIPHDFHRFTRERLEIILKNAGFHKIDIIERGNDISAIANKLIVVFIRIATSITYKNFWWCLPLLIPTGLLSLLMLTSSKISETFDLGSKEDPLGYFVSAIKAPKATQK